MHTLGAQDHSQQDQPGQPNPEHQDQHTIPTQIRAVRHYGVDIAGVRCAAGAIAAVPSISRKMRGMMVLVAPVNLDDADDFLRDLAMRHGIRRLALFGSVLRGEDTPASDIDLLVEFEEGRTPGLLSMAEMELELGAVFGREVELRTYEDLSRYFRDDVQAQARVLYAA
ncbi:MAG: nucleotidyltransferase family protein [Pseudonocardiaceae bacterium]